MMKCEVCKKDLNKAHIKYDDRIWVDRETGEVEILKPFISQKVWAPNFIYHLPL